MTLFSFWSDRSSNVVFFPCCRKFFADPELWWLFSPADAFLSFGKRWLSTCKLPVSKDILMQDQNFLVLWGFGVFYFSSQLQNDFSAQKKMHKSWKNQLPALEKGFHQNVHVFLLPFCVGFLFGWFFDCISTNRSGSGEGARIHGGRH